MIKRNEDHKVESAEHMFGEEGSVVFKRIAETADDLYGKGRIFSEVTLEKDCGLGWHVHQGDGEFYYVVSGEAEYSDNGVMPVLKAGDPAFCPNGEGHSVKNKNDEPFVFIALVIYD